MADGELDLSSGVPLYRQIKDILRGEIMGGVADPQKPMTEAQLLDRFDVSRAPIRQALRELTNEGYVYRKQGKGTFPVPGARVDRPPELRAGTLYQYLAERGLNPTAQVTGLARVVPPDHIRERLRMEPGESVTHFRRLISLDGSPLVEADVYVRGPEGFAPKASDLESQGSAFELLERDYGITLDRAEHEAWATAASASHAEVLGVPVGSPLLVIETIFFTTGGVPSGWRVAHHLADEFKYRFVTDG
ncbi:MAG: GntR family transcriptional regulator [Dermatophilus congolensis]|nr:GntR family transcriptional regulator [Dermatophilus congolensis]